MRWRNVILRIAIGIVTITIGTAPSATVTIRRIRVHAILRIIIGGYDTIAFIRILFGSGFCLLLRFFTTFPFHASVLEPNLHLKIRFCSAIFV